MNDWVNAEQHAERARTFFQSGQWEKALDELRHAISLNPEQAEWHFGMGLTLDAMHRFEEAVVSYQDAHRLRGDDPEVMMHIGVDLHQMGQHAQAIEWLERCNRVNPAFEPGYCFRIAAYARLGEHEKAEEMFYLARQIQDECPTCLDHLAHSLEARGQDEKAIWCWQQTLRLAPDHPQVRADLARAHVRQGQLERASVLFEQQLAHHPDDLATRLRVGKLQMQLERFVEAGKAFRSVLDVNPLVAEAHYYLSELAMRAGHLDEAVLQCERTAQLDPTITGLHHRWAMAQLQRGRFDLAQPLLMIELDKPDHTPTQVIEISRTLIDVGMLPQAIALLSRMVEEADFAAQAQGRGKNLKSKKKHSTARTASAMKLATVLMYRGYAFLVTGRRQAGIEDCRRAIRMAPDNLLTLHNLAMAYFEEGQLRRAGYFLRRAKALDPKDPMIKRLTYRMTRLKVTGWLKKVFRRA